MDVAERVHRFNNRFRKIEWVSLVYRRVRDVLSGPGWGAFHHDPIYRRMMIDLTGAFPFTAFVETGTYRGYSSEFVARAYPNLPLFTTEVNETNYQMSRRFLSKYRNVTALLGSSDQRIAELLAAGRTGEFPLYFLDAHWQRYWPLRDELKHITGARGRAVVVIDDFEVPGQPQFEFDVDGGGEHVAGDKCNLDYIRPALAPGNNYLAAFPKYSRTDAYGSARSRKLMRGHIVLFQNDPGAYDTFLRRPIARDHYFGHGEVPAAPAISATMPADAGATSASS